MSRVLMIFAFLIPISASAIKIIVPIESHEAEVCAEWLTRNESLQEGRTTTVKAEIQRTTVPGSLYKEFRAGLRKTFREGEVDLHIDVSSERGTQFYTFTYSNAKLF